MAVALAILATLLWSGNFIVARATIDSISPVQLAFGRWLTASIIMIPIGLRSLKREWAAVVLGKTNIFLAGLFGVSLFNTLVYIAGHHAEAIQIALIGTTSSPVFSFLLARIFLKEKIPGKRVLGLLICITGIVWMITKGRWNQLGTIGLSTGDIWILLAALSFAAYNIFVKARPIQIGSVAYLTSIFFIGTALLAPFALTEMAVGNHPEFSYSLLAMVGYLGAGTSVAAFFCWNKAIGVLGAARASLFGMLIPVFSSFEAVIFLNEKILPSHIMGMVLVFLGVFLANMKNRDQVKSDTANGLA